MRVPGAQGGMRVEPQPPATRDSTKTDRRTTLLIPLLEGNWKVIFPNGPDCEAYGRTREEALANGDMQLRMDQLRRDAER